jgi:hypothetical protein
LCANFRFFDDENNFLFSPKNTSFLSLSIAFARAKDTLAKLNNKTINGKGSKLRQIATFVECDLIALLFGR